MPPLEYKRWRQDRIISPSSLDHRLQRPTLSISLQASRHTNLGLQGSESHTFTASWNVLSYNGALGIPMTAADSATFSTANFN